MSNAGSSLGEYAFHIVPQNIIHLFSTFSLDRLSYIISWFTLVIAKKWLRPILSHRSTSLLGVSNHSVSVSGKMLLAFAITVILGSKLHGTYDHIFPLPALTKSWDSLCSNHSVLSTSSFCIKNGYYHRCGYNDGDKINERLRKETLYFIPSKCLRS
jgi:hypothetical protein